MNSFQRGRQEFQRYLASLDEKELLSIIERIEREQTVGAVALKDCFVRLQYLHNIKPENIIAGFNRRELGPVEGSD